MSAPDFRELGYVRSSTHDVWHRPGLDARLFSRVHGTPSERAVADAVFEASDRSVFSPELWSRIVDWPTFAHLSVRPYNLLRPFRTRLSGRVLHVGPGMGGLTRGLGEAGLDVVALEGRPFAARVTAARCRDLSNVRVVVDVLASFSPRPAFSAIVVTDFAGLLRDGGGLRAALDELVTRLLPGGRLYLGVENPLGLRRLVGAGSPGPTLSTPEDGPLVGERDLRDALTAAGLSAQDWWYPFPDHLAPMTLIAERARDTALDLGSLAAGTVSADVLNPKPSALSMQDAWVTAGRNDAVFELSNAFLVEASAAELPPNSDLAWHFGSGLGVRFAKSVRFYGAAHDIEVERSVFYAQRGFLQSAIARHVDVDEPFREGTLWRDALPPIVSRPGWTIADLTAWAERWWSAVGERAALGEGADLETVLDPRLLDAVPRNLIAGADGDHFIDLEWEARRPLELGWLLFRGLSDSFGTLDSFAPPAPDVPDTLGGVIRKVAKGLGTRLPRRHLERYWAFEVAFQTAAGGSGDESSVAQVLHRRLPIARDPEYRDPEQDPESQNVETQLRESLQQAREENLALRDTLSWRLTRPLRQVRRLRGASRLSTVLQRLTSRR